IVNSYILPTLDQYTVENLISDVLMQNLLNGTIVAIANNTWTTANADLFETTGWFSLSDPLIQPDAIIQFAIAGIPTWVAVKEVLGDMPAHPNPNTAGPVTLAQEVPTGSTVLAILPSASVLPDSTIQAAMITRLQHNLSFSL